MPLNVCLDQSMLAAQNDVYLVFHAMMQILRITLTDVVYVSGNYQLNHTLHTLQTHSISLFVIITCNDCRILISM